MLDDNEIQNDCFYCLACDECENAPSNSEAVLWIGAVLTVLISLVGLVAIFW